MASAVGAACGLVLWFYQIRSGNSLMGTYAHQMAHGGPFRDAMFEGALALGAVALLAGFLGCVGARRMGPLASFGVVCGLIAISYPVLAIVGVLHSVGGVPF